MVLICNGLFESWRIRLGRLQASTSWRHQIEKKVLTYLLLRYRDAFYATPPQQPLRLGRKRHDKSNTLRLNVSILNRINSAALAENPDLKVEVFETPERVSASTEEMLEPDPNRPHADLSHGVEDEQQVYFIFGYLMLITLGLVVTGIMVWMN